MCPRRVYRTLLIALLFLAFLSTASSLSAASRGIRVVSKEGQSLYLYKDYYAVVIGVSDYDHWPKLPNAVKDIQEVAEKLKVLGFTVKLIVNPDSRQLKSSLTEIARRLGTEKNRALLLYYAGHGETTTLADGTELGYIIPKDCPLQSLDPFGFDSKAVSMKEIEMLALKVRSKHMLVMFDSCFSGSLFALSRAAPTDIAEKSAKPVRQFMTAGGADETVPDRSIFKVCFLQGLDGEADYNRDSYVTASELGLYLQTKVVNYTRGAQHPQFGKINNPYLDKGDFIFVLKPPKPKAVEATAPAASSPTDKDRMSAELERLRQERKKIEAEKRMLEKEKQKLAYIPQSVKSARVSLRNEPQERLTTDYIKYMVKRYDFFENNWNVSGSFENDLVENGDGTVTDRATGLMWQKSGSSRSKTWRRAELYIAEINENKFAGYWDWRLPTIDELASLMEKKDVGGLHLDPLFDRKQTHCWSSDKGPELTYGSLGLFAAWIVNFSEGRVKHAQWAKGDLARYNNLDSNYTRAVRSLKSQSQPKVTKATALAASSPTDRDRMSAELERLRQERKKLEAEKRMLEKEKQKLAYIPKAETGEKLSLRKESKTLREVHAKEMLKRYGFFDSHMNAAGDFRNDLVDNGDGTITDRATGLMWQQGGSRWLLTFKRAKPHIRKLNKNKHAGYSDWRLPTIDELASLLQRDQARGLHIHPLFDERQTSCWSSDESVPWLGYTEPYPQAWHANFRDGSIGLTILPIGRIGDRITNRYVRAVRSIKNPVASSQN